MPSPIVARASPLDLPAAERGEIFGRKRRRRLMKAHEKVVEAEAKRALHSEQQTPEALPTEPEESPDEPLTRRRRVGPSTDHPASPASRQSPPPELQSPPPAQPSPPPAQPSPQPEYQPYSASSSRVPEDSAAPLMLWPDPDNDFPLHVFDNFIFQHDEVRFEESTVRDLAEANAEYLSKASAVTGRLLHRLGEVEREVEERQAEAERQEARRLSAVAGWSREKTEHAKTAQERDELRAEMEKMRAEAADAEKLRAELDEAEKN